MQALLRNVASWLKPEGLLFVHIFTHKSLAYHFEVRCIPDVGRATSSDPSAPKSITCLIAACMAEALPVSETALLWLAASDPALSKPLLHGTRHC